MVTERGQVEQGVLHCGGRAKQHRSVARHGSVDEHRRSAAQGLEFAVQPARRQHHEPIDVAGERSGGPDLLARVFARVGQQDLQIGLPGGAFDGPDHRPEVGVRDVRDDDGDVARPPRLHHLGRPVRNETKLGHRGLDALAGVGRDLLRATQRPRDRGRVHTGPGRNVENRHGSGRRHDARRYPESRRYL